MHEINNINYAFMHFPLKAQRGRSIAQAASRRPVIVDTGIRSQAGQYVICEGQSSTGTNFLHVRFTYPVDTIRSMLRTSPSIPDAAKC